MIHHYPISGMMYAFRVKLYGYEAWWPSIKGPAVDCIQHFIYNLDIYHSFLAVDDRFSFIISHRFLF